MMTLRNVQRIVISGILASRDFIRALALARAHERVFSRSLWSFIGLFHRGFLRCGSAQHTNQGSSKG